MTHRVKPINILSHLGELEKSRIHAEKNNHGTVNGLDHRVRRTSKCLEDLLCAKKPSLDSTCTGGSNHKNKCKKNPCEPCEPCEPHDPCEPREPCDPCSSPRKYSEKVFCEPSSCKDSEEISTSNWKKQLCHSKPKCKKECKYCNIWDAYWPFVGTAETDPTLRLQVDTTTFNGTLIEKWIADLPTPSITTFPIKNLFKLDVSSSLCNFDFNFRFENIVDDGDPTVINVNPKSTTNPLQLNQYLLIKDLDATIDPNIILAAIAYYNSTELYLNQFTGATDSFDTVKNLLLSTQLFFAHIIQTKEDVKLSITHNTGIGENLFKVCIETKAKVEIKETIIPVTGTSPPPPSTDIVILQRTIYINGKYFMTYAIYVNDVAAAAQLGGPTFTNDPLQIPLQLATMVLFGATTPVPDLNTVVPTTDHERALVKLFKDILLQNP